MKSRLATLAFALSLACLIVAFGLLMGRKGEERRVSGAMRALDFWAESRAYPGKTFPSRGYYQAFKYSKARLTEPAGKAAQTTPWYALGPHNFGGRTLAVALNPQNPNTVYAGSASGGLWRSTSGGAGAAAWQYVSTGHPVLGVSSIAIAPDDSNTMYIGTGEVYAYNDTQGGLAIRLTRGSFGIGVLKTGDGGQTWSKSLDWSYNQERGVWAVRIDPTNSNIVWAGTTEGTYKSIDAGQNWTQVDATIMVTDLVINPAHPDTVFIACGNLNSANNGIYRTLDGGANWAKMNFPTVIPDYQGKAQLSICESSPNVVLASIGNGGAGSEATWLVRSDDNGDSWYRVSTTDYSAWQGWFSHDVAVNPEDPNEVIAVGIDVWKSTTGGSGLVQKSDWTAWFFGQTPPGGPEGPPNYSHADHHDVVYHPANSDIIYLANDGGVFRSLDGGETFAGCNGGYQTQQFYAGFSSSETDSQLAMGGLQDNATAIYVGSDAWVRDVGGDGCWTVIDDTDNDIIYASWQYLNIVKSTNGGGGWFEIHPPSSGNVSFVAPYVACRGHLHETLYAGRSRIYKSINGGIGWLATNAGQEIDSGNPALTMAVARTNCSVVYATTAPVAWRGHVFRTTNGGGSWDDITGSLPDRYFVGLAVDPTDEMTVYITLSGFGASHLYKSTNGGDVWVDIDSALPDVPTQSVIVDPLEPDHVYVGNDLGVYYSPDGGGSWFDYSSGLPDAVVAMDLSVSESNGMLRVVTHGNGVFERPLVSTMVGVERLEVTQSATSEAVVLRWFADPGEQYAGFNVYRADARQPEFELISHEPIEGWGWLSFEDRTGEIGRVYRYKIGALGRWGERFSREVEAVRHAPDRLVGLQSYPNPFNPSTTFAYWLMSPGPVKLTVFDAAGRHVRTLLDRAQEAGEHSVRWDGRDDRGARVPSGVYMCELTVAGRRETKKVMMLK